MENELIDMLERVIEEVGKIEPDYELRDKARDLLAKAKAASQGKTTLSWSDAVLHSYSERWAESGVYHLEWVDADHVRLTKIQGEVPGYLSGGESHPPRK